MTNARGRQIPVQGTMVMMELHLACFWCISVSTDASMPPVVLRKGLELLEVEAQTSRRATTGFWGTQESGKEGEGIGDGWTCILAFKATGQQVQAKGRVQLSREPEPRFQGRGRAGSAAMVGRHHAAFLGTCLGCDTPPIGPHSVCCRVSDGEETGQKGPFPALTAHHMIRTLCDTFWLFSQNSV